MTTYTLFNQTGTGGVLQTDHSAQTQGVQFSVSAAATLTAIWFYSPAAAGDLPSSIGLYQVTGTGTGTLIHSESASWSGAAGSGWIRAPFSSPPSLTASTNYKAVQFHTAGSSNFYSETDNYWSSGAGSGGITNGILSAPNNAGADIGQDSYNSGSSITYPASTFSSANYWIDPEVTPSGVTVSGAVSALTLAAAVGIPTAQAPGPAAGLTLNALAGTPTVTGSATIQGVTAAMTLRAPAGSASGGSGDSWLFMAGIL